MQRTLKSIAAPLGCFFIACAMAGAQTVVGVAEVPFSFTAAGMVFDSGKYTLSHTALQSGMLRGSSHGAVQFLLGTQGPSEPAHLTFNRYGNKYFLREICEADGTHSTIPVSADEREIIGKQQTAAVQAVPVALVAHR